MRYIKLLLMSAFIFLIMLTGCKKESKITVTYIIDDEVYETCELNVGEKAANVIETQKADAEKLTEKIKMIDESLAALQ